MATVNRYTKIEPARYNPRSLQELMIAPSYMREQHSAIEEGMAGVETGLAGVDPLSIHSEQARMEQQKMYDQITQQSDQLAKEGFNPASKSALLKLNKQYQQAVSPTGQLGKIQAAKKMLDLNKATYIENATKAGYDPEKTKLNWEDFQKKYEQEFNETGKISSIGELYAPKYFDYIEEGSKLFKEAGLSSSDVTTGGGKIKKGADGTYVVNYENRNVQGDNQKQLEAAVEFINKRIMNPNSDANRSIQHQRMSPEQAVAELAGLSDVYVKEQTQSVAKSSISNFNPADGNDITNNGGGLALANEQFAPARYSDLSYQDVKGKISELSSKKDLNTTERQELYELQQYTDRLEETFKGDPKYTELSNSVKDAEEAYRSRIDGTYNYRQDAGYQAALKQGEEVAANYKRRDAERASAFANQMKGELDEFIQPYAKTVQHQLTDYQVVPSSTKQASTMKIVNENIDRLFKGNPQNILSMVNLENVDLDGELINDLSSDDKDGIASIIRNSKNGAVELMQFSPKGFSGKPEYVLRIATEEGNDYDMDKLGRGDIGGGKPVTIRVSFNETGNALVKNVNGLMQNYVASTGPLGAELVDDMETNRIKSNYVNKSWGDVEEDGSLNNDAGLLRIRDRKLGEMGITINSTPEEYDAAVSKLSKQKIK